jgi:hypothetical protein
MGLRRDSRGRQSFGAIDRRIQYLGWGYPQNSGIPRLSAHPGRPALSRWPRSSCWAEHIYHRVGGWLRPEIAHVVRAVGRLQDRHSVRGDLVEFGVHHGKFLLLIDALHRCEFCQSHGPPAESRSILGVAGSSRTGEGDVGGGLHHCYRGSPVAPRICAVCVAPSRCGRRRASRRR